MTPEQEHELTEDDLQPGEPCPICEEPIVTWFTRQLRDPEEMASQGSINGFCWVYADKVEPTGINTGFSGNTILIDHEGPSL